MINPRLDLLEPEELAEWLLNDNLNGETAARVQSKADARAIHLSLVNLRTLDLLTVIGGLPTTCLLVHSRDDPLVQIPDPEMLADLPFQMHDIVFEESGHFPMLDESSRFNRLMGDFLALLPGQTPRDLMLKEEWKRRVR
jgi:pimeloyl-ACP methyl ester carboxylesterase